MLEWTKIDAGPDSENYVDKEQEHYLIQQHEEKNFAVVWAKYPDAFMIFCKTAEKAKIFCEEHKTSCVGLSEFCKG